MNKLKIVALAVLVAFAGSAAAQSREQLRHEALQIKEQKRKIKHARRAGDTKAEERERDKLRVMEQKYREDKRRYKEHAAAR